MVHELRENRRIQMHDSKEHFNLRFSLRLVFFDLPGQGDARGHVLGGHHDLGRLPTFDDAIKPESQKLAAVRPLRPKNLIFDFNQRICLLDELFLDPGIQEQLKIVLRG